jgi:hypothetical protein
MFLAKIQIDLQPDRVIGGPEAETPFGIVPVLAVDFIRLAERGNQLTV